MVPPGPAWNKPDARLAYLWDALNARFSGHELGRITLVRALTPGEEAQLQDASAR